MKYINILSKKELVIFLLVFGFTQVFNLMKPVRIDDNCFIDEAKWIAEHFDHPLQGYIKADNVQGQIKLDYHPIFFQTLLALTGKSSNFSLLALHCLMAVFTFWAMVFGFLIFRKINGENYLLYFILLFCSPLFVISQNLMLDVPMFSLIIGAVYFLLFSDTKYHIFFSSIFFGFALVTKYASIPLVVIYPLYLYLYKEYKKVFQLFPIILIYALWTIWNLYDIGIPHFFVHRPNKPPFSEQVIFRAIFAVGSLALFFDVLIINKLGRYRYRIFFINLLLNILIHCLYLFDIISFNIYQNSLVVLNCILGIILLYELFFLRSTDKVSQIIWVSIIVYFVVLIAQSPFVAARHFIVFFFLVLTLAAIKHKGQIKYYYILIIGNIIWTSLMATSDYKQAEFYQVHAQLLSQKYQNHTIYTIGHHSWQYYADKNKFIIYDSLESKPQKGNLLIVPSNTYNQQISKTLRYRAIEVYTPPHKLSETFMSNKMAFYTNGNQTPIPIIFSKTPVDTFKIYEIKE